MKILILGGSGILSTDFTKKCLDEENEVYILNRGLKPHFIDPRSLLIRGDLRSESLKELKERIFKDCVFYDIVIDFLSYNVKQMKRTFSILGHCFQQYIFISSATVYKKNFEDEVITESTPTGNNKWRYAYDKYLCEDYLKSQNLNYTIIRPYVTYGKNRIPFPIIPEKRQFTLIARILENKPVILFNEGEAICTLTNTIDFANILYELLLNKKAFREDFHITGSSEQTWREVYMCLCELLDRQPHIVSANIGQIKKYMPEYSEILLGDKGCNMRFDNAKVMNAIGHPVSNLISLQDGLKKSINFFMSNDYMQGIDFKFDGECDHFAKKLGINCKKIKLGKTEFSNRGIDYYIMKLEITNMGVNKIRKIRKYIRSGGGY